MSTVMSLCISVSDRDSVLTDQTSLYVDEEKLDLDSSRGS